MSVPLLEVIDATKIYRRGFWRSKEEIFALQDFNLRIAGQPATITTIAGESGSGKSTLANAILGFLNLTSGKILFKGEDIARLAAQQRVEYRRQVQPIFQDPFEVFNPFYRVKHIFDLVIRNFGLARNGCNPDEMIADALKVVGLRADEVLEKYPHQLSGGQRQRMMIARAYLLKPALIVADEPVSMVDASLRSMILDTMMRLRDEFNISFLYITHDLSTAYQISDSIYILYQGVIAESGSTERVIENAKHPYVQLLIDSIPEPNPRTRWREDIAVPNEETFRLGHMQGCRFYPRCPHRMERCRDTVPHPIEVGDADDSRYMLHAHRVACLLYDEESETYAQSINNTSKESYS
jgi:peptide/nickel transport system ATP-binding protein